MTSPGTSRSPRTARLEDLHTPKTSSVVPVSVSPVSAKPPSSLVRLWEEDDGSESTLLSAIEPTRRVPRLTVVTGHSAGQVVPLNGPTLVVGSSPTGDLRLSDEGISRQHCRILRRAGGFLVEDMDSTNGTYLNGARVIGRRVIEPGDRIQLGATVLQVGNLDDPSRRPHS